MAMFDVVACLTAPVIVPTIRAPDFGCSVLYGGIDLFDLTGGEVEGVMKGMTQMLLNALEGIGSTKVF